MSSRLAALIAFGLLVCANFSVSNAETAPDAPPQPELVAAGKTLYAQHCSHCHGFNMVNPGTVTYDLRKFPHNDKDRFVNSVIYGKGGIMPPWGNELSLDDIDALWGYVLTGGKT